MVDRASTQKLTQADGLIAFSTLCLILVGTVMIYSASSPVASENFGDHFFFLKKHLLMLILGLIAFAVGFGCPIQIIKKYSFFFLLAVFVLLVFVAFSSLGVEAKHATRWISIAGIRFQPSEFAKPAIVLFTAAYIDRMGHKIKLFLDGLVPILVICGIFCLLLLKQPDFGTAATIAVTVLIMLFAANARIKHIAILFVIGALLSYFLIINVEYRRDRLLTFLDPWSDPRGRGFQIIQSFIAFKRGGLQGQGLGDGTQKLLYLPEAHTDFIFSVIAEELGFLGSVAIILLFSLLVFRGLALAVKIKDSFGSMLALGLISVVGLQAFFNMSVVMGLLPTKGLTLPFVSYGGSALITDMFCIGIILSLSAKIDSAPSLMKKRIV